MTDAFSDLLTTTATAGRHLRVAPSAGSGFLFGGYTMAVALTAAATTTASGLVPKSLRTSFVSFGDWAPIDVRVEDVQTTRSFAGRRLLLTQGERTVAAAEVSFHRPEEGVDRSHAPMPSVAGPDTLPRMETPLGGLELIDLRPVRPTGEQVTGRIHPYWARTLEHLGDDPALHGAGLAFISDYMVIYTPFEPGAGELHGLRSFTLEHSLWFHRPFAADRWLLFDATPLSQSGGRYVSRGTVHDERGHLVASFVQEGFVRPAG